LNLWVENLVIFVKTFKTKNYGTMPEDKWLLVGLLNNKHKAMFYKSFYYYQNNSHLWDIFLKER